MRIGVACFLFMAAACEQPSQEVGSSPAGLSGEPPAWLASATVAEARFGARLLRGEAEPAPEATDVRMPIPYAVARADGSIWVAPPMTVAATLMDGAVAWVDVEGSLFIDDGEQARGIDEDVHGELAVDPTGRLLAYALRPGERAGVWVVERSGGAPRKITPGLAIADRPVFVDRERLVVVGSRPGGIAGVWIVRYLDAEAQPIPLTNAALRAGAPLGPTFVPPPAYHESMRIEDGVLVYDDGEGAQRVELPELDR